MKVGDLVELSAYGKKLKCFLRLHGHHGIIIKRYHELSHWKIHWLDMSTNYIMNQKEIKHVKAKKTLDKPANL